MKLETNWLRCECPTYSQWGAIQTKRELAPGIWTVTTAGHGGVKLSRERNAAVPDYMRAEGGWYEEDCQWCIAALVHPEAFQRVIKTEGKPDRTEQDIARATLRDFYPDEFERWTGMTLVEGESFKRDQSNFEADNAGHFVVRAAWGTHAAWVPKGWVGVLAVRESDGCEKYFMVPADEYAKPRSPGCGFVIDLERHKENMGGS